MGKSRHWHFSGNGFCASAAQGGAGTRCRGKTYRELPEWNYGKIRIHSNLNKPSPCPVESVHLEITVILQLIHGLKQIYFPWWSCSDLWGAQSCVWAMSWITAFEYKCRPIEKKIYTKKTVIDGFTEKGKYHDQLFHLALLAVLFKRHTVRM